MATVLKCRRTALKAGSHEVVLASCEVVPSPMNRDRDAYEFRFVNAEGEFSKITGTTLRIGEALHDLAQQIFAKTIGPDEEIDLDEAVGRKFQIVLKQTRTNGIAIDRITPLVG